jgi:hypothetical protein
MSPIKEEVYVEKSLGFEDNMYLGHVYKLSKSLYGLKQALRAWYECLIVGDRYPPGPLKE